MKQAILSILFLLAAPLSWAQTAQLQGKVVDEKGEGLIGATVLVDGTTQGAKTDLQGQFAIRNIADGTYSLTFSYVSYEKKTITDIIVKNGKAEFLQIAMSPAGKGLKEVIIKTQLKKESINALLIQQKNLSTISDGISAEMMKRTPDRSSGDVLKRVSGVSIAENKFAIIRGLADRYNMALLNGDILPSSEADRKAFSFDVFPAALLENMVIIKAATPDRPAEFAGGIIEMSTKDIPTEKFFQVQLGTGMNTQSTFKPYSDSKNSKTDWLGFDNSLRVIPNNFPTTEMFQATQSQFPLANRLAATKQFSNTWGTQNYESMLPFRTLQLSAGTLKTFKKESAIGITSAISYNRNQRTYHIDRSEVNGTTPAYLFNDVQYRDNVLVGALFNVGYKINNRHKLNFKNTLTVNTEDQTVIRNGNFYDNEYYVRGSALWYNTNQLLANQLSGEHALGKRNIKVQWGLARNAVARAIPDLRRTQYTRNYDAPDSLFRASVSTFPNPFFMGRFFGKTTETIYNGHADVSMNYNLFKKQHVLKGGIFVQDKSRDYSARILAYVRAKSTGFQQDLLTLPETELFSDANIRDNGFVMNDATLPTDSYNAHSSLKAGYIMTDQKWGDKLRAVYGLRYESFQQELITGNLVPGDRTIEKANNNLLPSMNLTWMMNKKTNVRFCASQTLSRPEFRELSPASFYDYNLSANFRGSETLEQTKIQNYDIRYEYFAGKGEIISGSVFYKHFTNPIELFVPKGLTTTQKIFSYVNAAEAQLMGVEFEFRKSLGFMSNKTASFWSNLSVFGNLAYIHSQVTVNDINAAGEKESYKRPMQGQSPYVLNGGVMYTQPKSGLAATVVFNRIGQRIFAVGNGEIPELFEAPRNVLDASISKKIAQHWEVKLTVSDILANPMVLYYNIDDKYQIVTEGPGKYSYQANKDYTVVKNRPGTNISLSVSYQLK